MFRTGFKPWQIYPMLFFHSAKYLLKGTMQGQSGLKSKCKALRKIKLCQGFKSHVFETLNVAPAGLLNSFWFVFY